LGRVWKDIFWNHIMEELSVSTSNSGEKLAYTGVSLVFSEGGEPVSQASKTI